MPTKRVPTGRPRGRPRKQVAEARPEKRPAELVPPPPVSEPQPPPMTYVGAFRRISKEKRQVTIGHVEKFLQLLRAGKLRPRVLTAAELAAIRNLEGA